MRRVPSEPRPDALALVEAEGLVYARDRGPDGAERPYWAEDAAYELDVDEVDRLERATDELHEMSLQATRVMADDPQTLARLGLPEGCGPSLRASLEDPASWSLYGRFDLAYDGDRVTLLEYNADTPAGLVEAAVTQWSWLEALHPDLDQWNLLHERLVQQWERHVEPGGVVHLAADEGEPVEDWATVAYLADTVQAAGRRPVTLCMSDLGWEPGARLFVDATDQHDPRAVTTLFAMYPWEWMLAEPFGEHALAGSRTRFLEPPYKVLTGSKALLVTLWQLYPDHPLLVPAAWTADELPDRGRGGTVTKPVYGWEGAGIRVQRGEDVLLTDPRHTAGQAEVVQAYVDLPVHDGARPVLGCWVVGGQASGLGIRESDGLVTDTDARFRPHYLRAPRSTPAQVAGWLQT